MKRLILRIENFEADQLRKEYGKIMKEVGQKKKESKGKDPCTVIINHFSWQGTNF